MLGGETWFNEFMIYYTEYTHNMRREEEDGGTGLFGCFFVERERERESTTTGFLWWPRYPRLLYYLLFTIWLFCSIFLLFGDVEFSRCVSLSLSLSRAVGSLFVGGGILVLLSMRLGSRSGGLGIIMSWTLERVISTDLGRLVA